MKFVGLDIGGANLKVSDGEEIAQSVPFPLWKTPERLSEAIAELLEPFGDCEGVAVNMTGELADCFRTKAEGVDFILRAVEVAAKGRPIFVWQTGAEFLTPDIAREIPLLVAAANWHALATWLGRMVPEGISLLIDLGSTTTDIIPLSDGVPIPEGMTDCERLCAGELVYTGMTRTPLCAIAQRVPFRGGDCPVAAELFATTRDVYLILGTEAESDDCETANGKPATRANAYDRLARMLCCDTSEVSQEELNSIANWFAAEQRKLIQRGIKQVLANLDQPPATILVSGRGRAVVESVLNEMSEFHETPRVFLEEVFPYAVSEAACAFAIARLATERIHVL